MYERILVPVDGSEPSARALEEALAIALGRRSAPAKAAAGAQAPRAPASQDPGLERPSLKLIHVLDDALDQSELIARGNTLLARAVERAGSVGIAAESAMPPAAGHRIADVILEEAKSYGADLIVLGSHGNTGLRQAILAILGSVAEEVISKSPVPVLLPGRPPSEL